MLFGGGVCARQWRTHISRRVGCTSGGGPNFIARPRLRTGVGFERGSEREQ